MAKIQIRRGVFETNSSSTHSITMVTNDQFNEWKIGNVLFSREGDCFIPNDDPDYLKWKEYKDNGTIGDDDYWENFDYRYPYLTYENFFHDYDMLEYETFCEKHTNKEGNVDVVAFGFYGYD